MLYSEALLGEHSRSVGITAYLPVSLAALIFLYCPIVFSGIGNRISLSVGKSQPDDELQYTPFVVLLLTQINCLTVCV